LDGVSFDHQHSHISFNFDSANSTDAISRLLEEALQRPESAMSSDPIYGSHIFSSGPLPTVTHHRAPSPIDPRLPLTPKAEQQRQRRQRMSESERERIRNKDAERKRMKRAQMSMEEKQRVQERENEKRRKRYQDMNDERKEEIRRKEREKLKRYRERRKVTKLQQAVMQMHTLPPVASSANIYEELHAAAAVNVISEAALSRLQPLG
jgi:flagellar biosynthesis GTPase FlhF